MSPLTPISIDTFADLIDSEAAADVFVVVHLLCSSISHCARLQGMLDELSAEEFKYTKFISISAEEAGVVLDRVAFPILQFYKRGELVHTIAAAHVEAGRRRYSSAGPRGTAEAFETDRAESEAFCKDDVEWLLAATISHSHSAVQQS